MRLFSCSACILWCVVRGTLEHSNTDHGIIHVEVHGAVQIVRSLPDILEGSQFGRNLRKVLGGRGGLIRSGVLSEGKTWVRVSCVSTCSKILLNIM